MPPSTPGQAPVPPPGNRRLSGQDVLVRVFAYLLPVLSTAALAPVMHFDDESGMSALGAFANALIYCPVAIVIVTLIADAIGKRRGAAPSATTWTVLTAGIVLAIGNLLYWTQLG